MSDKAELNYCMYRIFTLSKQKKGEMVKISAQILTGTQTCKNWNNKVIFALGINQSGKNKDTEVLWQG